MRTTTGHPTRALRGGALLIVLWVTYRAPAMRAAFDAAINAAGATSNVVVAASVSRWRPRTAPTIQIAFSPAPILESPTRYPPLLPATKALVRPAADVARANENAVVPVAATVPPEPRQQPSAIPSGTAAGDYATAAYARLSAGDRRSAARLFDAALATAGDPRSAAWRAERDALNRRWSGSAYSIVRAGGASDLAVAPVLGGGQSGAALAWAPDPLSPRPLALTLRGTIAHDDGGRSALAAVGTAWHPFTGVTLAAERLLPLGPAARGDWAVRIAGGVNRTAGAIDASVYGEAGAVGPVAYAAAQAHLGATLRRHGIAFGPGFGGWASIQSGRGSTVDRFDFGPGVTARTGRLSLSADYRFRVAGNAAPRSGPVLTLAAAF
ncbi:MAG: hypothetical protein ACRYG4_17240 [Janthinobacterium lividum]